MERLAHTATVNGVQFVNERRMKMGEMMTFPASVEEFMEQYKMTATEHEMDD